MNKVLVLLTICLISSPAIAQQPADFVSLLSTQVNFTPNDVGDNGFSKEVELLDAKIRIDPAADEVLMLLNMTKQTKATGMEIILENAQVNLNKSYPLQQYVKTEKIKILPLKGNTNISLLLHWYALLGAPSCNNCQVENLPSVRIKLFTDTNQWDGNARVDVHLSHRQRAVTIDDFIQISISNPVNPVERATVTTSFGSTPTDTDRIETTTVTITTHDSSSDELSSNTPQLPLPNLIFLVLLTIAAFRKRRFEKMV